MLQCHLALPLFPSLQIVKQPANLPSSYIHFSFSFFCSKNITIQLQGDFTTGKLEIGFKHDTNFQSDSGKVRTPPLLMRKLKIVHTQYYQLRSMVPYCGLVKLPPKTTILPSQMIWDSIIFLSHRFL